MHARTHTHKRTPKHTYMQPHARTCRLSATSLLGCSTRICLYSASAWLKSPFASKYMPCVGARACARSRRRCAHVRGPRCLSNGRARAHVARVPAAWTYASSLRGARGQRRVGPWQEGTARAKCWQGAHLQPAHAHAARELALNGLDEGPGLVQRVAGKRSHRHLLVQQPDCGGARGGAARGTVSACTASARMQAAVPPPRCSSTRLHLLVPSCCSRSGAWLPPDRLQHEGTACRCILKANAKNSMGRRAASHVLPSATHTPGACMALAPGANACSAACSMQPRMPAPPHPPSSSDRPPVCFFSTIWPYRATRALLASLSSRLCMGREHEGGAHGPPGLPHAPTPRPALPAASPPAPEPHAPGAAA